MAVEQFVVGSYAATYDGTSTGITRNGYRITHDQKAEAIEQSDVYGKTMLDAIWQGANVSCEFTCMAFVKGLPVLNPFTAALFTLWTTANPMGRLFSDLAKALVLTVTANTPAAAVGVGPSTLTASKAILAPNYSATYAYDNTLRELPLRLQFLPYTSTGLIFAATT
jgi:hypothetical protein